MVIESHEERLARQDAEDDQYLRQLIRHEAKVRGISVEDAAKKMLLGHLLPL
jgi:hypothetical protein